MHAGWRVSQPTFRDRPIYCSFPSREYTAYTPAVGGKLLAWPSSVRTGMASAVERLLLVLAAAQTAGDLRAASALCLLVSMHDGRVCRCSWYVCAVLHVRRAAALVCDRLWCTLEGGQLCRPQLCLAVCISTVGPVEQICWS